MDPQQAHVSHPDIPEQDPARDIDGKKIWMWLIGSAIGVILSVFLIDQVFHLVTHQQRIKQIEEVPAVQLEALRAEEREALSAGEGRKSVDAAIEAYIRKKQD